MKTFEELCFSVLEEKKTKQKVMSNFDCYKSIRKPVPKPGTAFTDKTKYKRSQKHKKQFNNFNE